MSLDSRLERILAGQPPALVDTVVATRLLMHTAALLEQHIDTVLAPLGLHLREYLALHRLADSVHEPISPSALSVSLHATRTQVTRLLDSLERQDLVVREADKSDRRSLALGLTAKGQALRQQAVALVHAAYADVWAVLGDDGTHTMQQQLRQVYEHLHSTAAVPHHQTAAPRTDDPAAP